MHFISLQPLELLQKGFINLLEWEATGVTWATWVFTGGDQPDSSF